MGSKATKTITIDPFGPLAEWNNCKVVKMLKDYKTQDLDFGLDSHGLSLILSGDTIWAESIIQAFGSKTGLINALSFITGACLVASGSVEEKAQLCFNALDFDGSEKITMDEMTIMFLCAFKGLVVMTGCGNEPNDNDMESITIEAYQEYQKENTQDITQKEFVSWIKNYLGNSEDITVEELLNKFKLNQLSKKDENTIMDSISNTLEGSSPLTIETSLNSNPVATTDSIAVEDQDQPCIE